MKILNKILGKTNEGPIPDGTSAADSTRTDILRTAIDPQTGQPMVWGQGDTRPGLPGPTARKNVTWVQPQATAAPVNPKQSTPDSPETWSQNGQDRLVRADSSMLATGSPGNPSTCDPSPDVPAALNKISQFYATIPTPGSPGDYDLSVDSYSLSKQMSNQMSMKPAPTPTADGGVGPATMIPATTPAATTAPSPPRPGIMRVSRQGK
ncbi:MAG TPA: hypothetical protein VFE98_08635 [Candidatus Bathyarchaeia archaeon]|nr:hypothetical protein [Candidatus Bathyarchaeia archaeon]